MRRHNRGLLIIAIYKWCTAALCALLALGLLKLLHQDVGDVAERVIRSLRGDPDNHVLAGLLARLSFIDDPQLAKLSVASFGYAALFLVEGTGLYYEQRWAEYLTIVATASFIPLEIYELIKQPDVLKISILIVNLAIIAFLVIATRKHASSKK